MVFDELYVVQVLTQGRHMLRFPMVERCVWNGIPPLSFVACLLIVALVPVDGGTFKQSLVDAYMKLLKSKSPRLVTFKRSFDGILTNAVGCCIQRELNSDEQTLYSSRQFKQQIKKEPVGKQ
jgi:hypothetical protein